MVTFQPTRPLRGATSFITSIPKATDYFNPRAPCGARQATKPANAIAKIFQPTRPLRGATCSTPISSIRIRISTHAPLAGRDAGFVHRLSAFDISTHAPLAGRDKMNVAGFNISHISTHAPLAGRDSKSVQITMHIFAITDKFQMLLHRMPPVRAFCSFLMQENHADFGCEPPK